MSLRHGRRSWFGDMPEASQGVPAFVSLCGCVVKLSRCQLLYLCCWKGYKETHWEILPIKKSRFFFMGMCYFLLRLPWMLSFPAFICFTHSEITFQFGTWLSLATFEYVHKKIYLRERFLANALFSVLCWGNFSTTSTG